MKLHFLIAITACLALGACSEEPQVSPSPKGYFEGGEAVQQPTNAPKSQLKRDADRFNTHRENIKRIDLGKL